MTSSLKLCHSPDFKDLIIATRDFFQDLGLTETLIEKDYYVTEALRIVAAQYAQMPNALIFKGGTSLSKAWNLIQRFSEDLDLFLNTKAFAPPLGEAKVNKTLKAIVAAVDAHSALTLDSDRIQSKKGIYRHAYFQYSSLFPRQDSIANHIFLEIGTRSGDYPIVSCSISSYVSQFLQQKQETLGTEDEMPFTMPVLHYKRTFVEKIFAIHSAIVQLEQHQKSIATQVRHYYDLYCLLGQEDIQNMLKTVEFQEIKEDVFRISKSAFSLDIDTLPENLDFSQSLAFTLSAKIENEVKKSYTKQMQQLCYGKCPSWEDVKKTLSDIKYRL